MAVDFVETVKENEKPEVDDNKQAVPTSDWKATKNNWTPAV